MDVNDQSEGLTKDSSERIGFVFASVFASAIDTAELNQWAMNVLNKSNVEQMPSYIIDLVDFSGALNELYKVVGFYPAWNRGPEAEDALTAIALLRGRLAETGELNRKAAMRAIESNQDTLKRFSEEFPFVAI